GGSAATAHYGQVSTHTTGHAESVEVTFDPAQVSYGDLLRVFFTVAHDPTELNRQGPDEGTQYRSAIFYATDAQWRAALAYIARLDPGRARARHRRPAGVRVQRTSRRSGPAPARIQPARARGRSVRLSVVGSSASSSPSAVCELVPCRSSACNRVNCVARSPASL